jgi:AcrR family transcriptional regulator
MSVDRRLREGARDSLRRPAGARLAPLYKRLPPGPHRLDREEVARHQRIRIHGAMVEAVAASGYHGTSVKQVIALAGVSRRSFYEQFSNKEECLLATFDLLAGNALRQAGDAYRRTEGPLQERMRAALGELAGAITSDRKAARLVMIETQTAGVAGLLRLRQATGRWERMLCGSFTGEPGASPLPVPVVRGIAGGLHAAMSMCVREEQAMRPTELTEGMLAWTLGFQTRAAAGMAQLIAERTRRSMAAGLGDPRAGRDGGGPPTEERQRLMEQALRLGAEEGVRELTAPRIAEQANVSIDAFFELFENKDECYLAAFDMLADRLLQAAGDAGLCSADWPRAVRRAIGELMLTLADRPHYARTIASEALRAGPSAVRRNVELASALATMLTEGAPGEPLGRLTVEGVGGAIWHTVRCQVASERIQLLPALSDYLSYVVLAPFIGADAAVEVVTEET